VVVLDQLHAAAAAALDLVGPRVVAAAVLRQAAKHAAGRDLDNAARVLLGARLDLEGLIQETVAAAVANGADWSEVAAAFQMTPNRARALWGKAVQVQQ